MQYEDFELQIGPRVAAGVIVRVQSPAGKDKQTIQLPKDLETLWASQSQARDLAASTRVAQRSVTEVGQILFRALFSGGVGNRFYESLGLIRAKGTEWGLRIRLWINPNDRSVASLQAFPWELLYRSETDDFLSLRILTPVVRSLDVPRPDLSQATKGPLRILAVSSQQKGGLLKLDDELEHMALTLKENASIQLDVLEHPSLEKIRKALRERSFHILHYLGHGTFVEGEGLLHFFNRNRSRETISGQQLATTIKDFSSLRLIMLNACNTAQSGSGVADRPFAGVAGALALGGAPAVVAMQAPIWDPYAVAFSTGFYNRLAKGLSVEEAITEGRQAIYTKSPKENDWAIPVLFLQSSTLFGPLPDTRLSPNFQETFPDVVRAQGFFESDLASEPPEARYFSESPSVRVRYHPILLRRASGAPSVVSIEHVAETLRGKGGQASLVLTTDFAPDLVETLWALKRRLALPDEAGQEGLVSRWIRGTSLLSNLDAQPGPRAELLILRAIMGHELSKGDPTEQLDQILEGRPSLFIVDFSDVRLEDVLAPGSKERINSALAALRQFAQIAGAKGHRTLAGFPRLLQASDPVWRFVKNTDLRYLSEELFASGQDFRVCQLHEIFNAQLQEPLQKLLSCNSNALGYAVLAFFIERGESNWELRNETEWGSLSAWLFRRGFYEIAYRLETHRRKPSRKKELLSLSFDVQPAKEPGSAAVMGIVDDWADLPRSVERGELVGEGGSGKTTTLVEIEREWILPVIADEGRRRESWLPIYFSVATSEGSLWQRLAQFWRRQAAGSRERSGLPQEELAGWTARGVLPYVFTSPLMLLVDGLDEVPAEAATSLSNELAEQPSPCGILAAARSDKYLSDAHGFNLVKLRALARKQIGHYLIQRRPGHQSNGRSHLLDLLGWQDRPVSGFLRNPYLLRCLYELNLNERDLAEISEGELLERWLAFKRESFGIGAEEWERASRNLAKLALDWAGNSVSWGNLGAEAWAWLDTARHIGVIEERRSGKGSLVRFTHAKLQDYFVAQALRQAWRGREGKIAIKDWIWERKEKSPLSLLMGLLDPGERSELLALTEERGGDTSLLYLRALPRKAALALPATERILRRQLASLDSTPPEKRAAVLNDLGPLDPRVGSTRGVDAFGDLLRISGVPYRLGKYPVTNLDFACFIEDGGYKKDIYWEALKRTTSSGPEILWPMYWLSEGHHSPNAPVVGVCAFEALAYCEWLNAKPSATRGGKYRFALPTVDQWLWAAHAADPGMSEILRRTRKKLSRVARHGEREGLNLAPELIELKQRVDILAPFLKYQELKPVGLTGYQASGCYDLYGGIWEWCDEWIVNVGGRDRPSQGSERHPTYVLGGPSSGPFDPTFVLAGGWFDPFLRFERIGFRIVRIEIEGDEP